MRNMVPVTNAENILTSKRKDTILSNILDDVIRYSFINSCFQSPNKNYYKSKYKKDTMAGDSKSQELGSPSIHSSSIHNNSNQHSLSHPSHNLLQPPSPHVPPTGIEYDTIDSPHNAPLGHMSHSLDNIEHIIANANEEDDELKSPKLSDNGPTSTLLHARHIVI